MQQRVESLKEYLDTRHREIAAGHHAGAPGFVTCTSLTAMIDRAVRDAFEMTRGSTDVAVLALGSYGRGELCPRSDVDVMVVRGGQEDRDAADRTATAFLHLLWDAGLNIGHSVRSIEEALGLHGKSVDSWTSMLESRIICGDRVVADTLFDMLRRRIAAGPDLWLIRGVFADIESRHQRFGDSVRLLEPNIKKSAGGFRDIQSALWLYRGCEAGYLSSINAGAPATLSFLDRLLAGGMLEADEHRAACDALQFLFRVRHQMHFLQNSLHDTLEYALQLKVADGLGYGDGVRAGAGRPVEVFMREYHLHARTVHLLHQRLTQRFREMIDPPRHVSQATRTVDGLFHLHEDVVAVDPGVRRLRSAREVFQAFVLAAENDLDLDFRLRGAIERSADLITPDETTSPDLAVMFRRILNSRHVAATLRPMSELNVLGRYIPEFGELVAFFQHNVYHFYTADEHTLIAIENAERLRDEQGILHDIFRTLPRKDLLYLALLLHDMAKPRGVADHEVTGVEIARDVLNRIGMDEVFPDVAFLVRNHLAMEHVAFRRNVHDPDTIREFASRFERAELLDYLYVLTYADLSAVNTNVWTEWKAAMLQELYRSSSEVLRRHLKGEQIKEFHVAQQERAADRLVERLSASMPRETVERHLKGMHGGAYVGAFTDEEIGAHIAVSSLSEPVSTLFAHSEGYTQVTVIAADAPFALSRFCAVLSANDANIFDANIFTREDGVIIDRFRVSDAATKQQLRQKVCTKIAEDLKLVMEGKLDIDHLFREHNRRWKRRPKLPPNPNIRTDVVFEDNSRFSIIDVYAPDSVGFLYRITETMSRLGLDIGFAKIATRGDGIVDSFYVRDRTGGSPADPARREAVRTEILSTIRTLARERLA